MVDSIAFTIALRTHAVSGAVALVIAPLAMVAAKGGRWHRIWGKVYFYAMAMVCLTAILMAVMDPNDLWLALIAVFSFHMVASGYRSLYLKKLHEGLRPDRTDLTLHGIAGILNGGLLIWGLSHLLMGVKDPRAYLYTLFGAIGMFMVFRYLNRFYRRRNDRREWFYGHMTGFLGGYIATLSAFSAVNLNWIEPSWLRWTWPTILGAPLIAVWTGYYRKKFASGGRVRDVAEVRIR